MGLRKYLRPFQTGSEFEKVKMQLSEGDLPEPSLSLQQVGIKSQGWLIGTFGRLNFNHPTK